MKWFGPGVILGLGAVVIFGNPMSQKLMCDGTDHCMIAWVSALSGWAALVGALLTVFVMREQLNEQRRQTDHIMGNAPPDMFIEPGVRKHEDEWYQELTITVVNRNRRPLRLEKFEFKSSEGIGVAIRAQLPEGASMDLPYSDTLRYHYIHRTIPGKDDGQPATRALIECRVFEGGTPAVWQHRDGETWQNHVGTIRLTAFQVDKRETEIVLEATVNFST